MEQQRHVGESSIDSTFPIQFQTLTGETIQATASKLVFRCDAHSASCELTFEVSGKDGHRILMNEWFHLFQQSRNQNPSLSQDQPVELSAALRPTLAQHIAELGGDAEAVLHALLHKQPAEEALRHLRQTECWLALEVKQSVAVPPELGGLGSLKTGLRTEWGHQNKAESPATAEESIIRDIQPFVASFLQANALKYERLDEQLIRLRFQSRGGHWIGLIHTNEADGLCAIYSVLPTAVPVHQRREISEYLMHINYDLVYGSFEMDQADGEVRFRTTMFNGHALTSSVFGMIFAEHLKVMEQYLPDIQQMIQPLQ